MIALDKIASVEAWLAQEVGAGDEAVSVHRDALRDALEELWDFTFLVIQDGRPMAVRYDV